MYKITITSTNGFKLIVMYLINLFSEFHKLNLYEPQKNKLILLILKLNLTIYHNPYSICISLPLSLLLHF